MPSATSVEDCDPLSALLSLHGSPHFSSPSDGDAPPPVSPAEGRRALSLAVGASYPVAPPLANYPIQPQPSPPPATEQDIPNVDHDAEDASWRFHFRDRPYVADDMPYECFRPAFRFGWESFAVLGAPFGRSFADVEHDLAEGWATHRGECCLDWEDACPAARDAWFHAAGQRRVARESTFVLRREQSGTGS